MPNSYFRTAMPWQNSGFYLEWEGILTKQCSNKQACPETQKLLNSYFLFQHAKEGWEKV